MFQETQNKVPETDVKTESSYNLPFSVQIYLSFDRPLRQPRGKNSYI
jgi:hypothetical protein